MIKLTRDVLPVVSFLSDIEKQQLPFAQALALTKLAQEARSQIAKEAGRVFDRPKPSTIDDTNRGPMFLRAATKKNPEAEVRVKDQKQVKGDPALVYLSHNILGGARVEKRSEFLLRNFGILPRGYYTVPGSGAKLDKYGNVSNGQIQQILSILSAQRDPTANSISEDGSRKSRNFADLKRRYFVANRNRQVTRHLPEGVWERIIGSRRIQPVLIFVPNAPVYRKRLSFYEIQARVASTLGPQKFSEAMAEAIAGAKFKRGSINFGREVV